MTQRDLQWVPIEDFRPGIFSTSRFASPHAKTPALGAASPTNTYRCMATPTGALGPGPKRLRAIDFEDFPDSGNTYQYYITGLATLGYVGDAGETERTEVLLGVNYLVPSTAVRFKFMRHRLFESPTSVEELATKDSTAQSATIEPRYTPIFYTRIHPTDPLQPGEVVSYVAWFGATNDDGMSLIFPDPDTPGTDSTETVGDPTTHRYEQAIAHQGRIVLAAFRRRNRGGGTNVSTGDDWFWTDPNENNISTANPTSFTVEGADFIADIASMSANEMVVVAVVGGGFVLRGSLDDVSVIALPNLASPLDIQTRFKGANTRIGFVYSGGLTGVHVWNGGDTSQLISPQLDGDEFWPDLDDTFDVQNRFLGHRGNATGWHDLVVLPRLWTFNTSLQSWWRLDDYSDYSTEVIHNSVSSFEGRLYTATWAVTEAAPEYLYTWEYQTPAESWSWESQPIRLVAPVDRQSQVRSVIAVLSGETQDVTITLTGEDGTSQDHTVSDFNSPSPTAIRFDYSLICREVQIRVEVDGTANSNPGAVLHSLHMGVQSAQSVPREH